MPLVTCPVCSKSISTAAISCPNCGHPFKREIPKNGDISIRPSSSFNLRIVAGFILLPLFFVAITDPLYLKPWSLAGKHSAARTLEGDSLNIVVKTIQAVTHPTGRDPQMHDLSIDMDDDGVLSVKITVDWIGGLVGGHYRTIVLWKCDKNRDRGLTIVSDNAPFEIEDSNLERLKDYFHDEIYTNVIKNAHLSYQPFSRFEK